MIEQVPQQPGLFGEEMPRPLPLTQPTVTPVWREGVVVHNPESGLHHLIESVSLNPNGTPNYVTQDFQSSEEARTAGENFRDARRLAETNEKKQAIAEARSAVDMATAAVSNSTETTPPSTEQADNDTAEQERKTREQARFQQAEADMQAMEAQAIANKAADEAEKARQLNEAEATRAADAASREALIAAANKLTEATAAVNPEAIEDTRTDDEKIADNDAFEAKVQEAIRASREADSVAATAMAARRLPELMEYQQSTSPTKFAGSRTRAILDGRTVPMTPSEAVERARRQSPGATSGSRLGPDQVNSLPSDPDADPDVQPMPASLHGQTPEPNGSHEQEEDGQHDDSELNDPQYDGMTPKERAEAIIRKFDDKYIAEQQARNPGRRIPQSEDSRVFRSLIHHVDSGFPLNPDIITHRFKFVARKLGIKVKDDGTTSWL